MSTAASQDEVLRLVGNLVQMRAPPAMAVSVQRLLGKMAPDDEALGTVAVAQDFAT